jgi:acyl-CoA thioester hydrolase
MDTHILPLRIYYEDTDFSGRVYHASYLRFFERGRTEWLRARGFEHSTLSGQDGVVFAVRSLNIDYLAPALMDDAVEVTTRLSGVKGALIVFEQGLLREGRPLATASVQVVTLKNEKATRPPREILRNLDRA